MMCTADLRTRQEEIQKDRIYDFLAGLDEVFDPVRSDLLRMKSVPGIEECFTIVRREAQRQVTMFGTKNTGEGTFMAMISKSTASSNFHTLRAVEEAEKDKLRCRHCNGSRHTRDTCFEIHGYPEWFLEKRKQGKARSNKHPGQAKLANTVEIPSSVAVVATAQRDHIKPGEILFLANTADSLLTLENIGMMFSTFTVQDTGWIIDSGATDHMTYNKSLFQYMTSPSKKKVLTANGESTPVIGAGSIALTPNLSLHNCLLVPALSNHLLSVSQITEELDCIVFMFPTFCLLQDIRTQAIIGRGTKRKGLYYVDDVASGHVHQVQSRNVHDYKNIWLWHHQLGHASFGYLQKLFPSLFNDISDPSSSLKCNVCILAKSHRTSYPLSLNKSTKPFELIHSDVWGPAPITTQSGIRWFITFVDDCTRVTWLYTMRHKSDVRNIFPIFYHMVCTQFSLLMKVIRSDNGGEYLNSELLKFFQDNGILHETTCLSTPQQNGVAERKNMHILETTRALLIGAHIPQHYWVEAMTYAVYLMNRMPSQVFSFRTPLQTLTQHVQIPSFLYLEPRVFGCVAYVHLQKSQRTKLDPCAVHYVFLGFNPHQKGYRCYHPSTHHMYVSMDVTFSETKYFFGLDQSTSSPQGEQLQQDAYNWIDLP